MWVLVVVFVVADEDFSNSAFIVAYETRKFLDEILQRRPTKLVGPFLGSVTDGSGRGEEEGGYHDSIGEINTLFVNRGFLWNAIVFAIVRGGRPIFIYFFVDTNTRNRGARDFRRGRNETGGSFFFF